MSPDSPNGGEPYLTVRQMVAEIREDQKLMQEQLSVLVAAPKIVEDHEDRIRSLERWKYAIPPAGIVALAALLAPLLVHTT